MWKLVLLIGTLLCAVSQCQASCDDCDEELEYCDKFEQECRSCRSLCSQPGKLLECDEKCEKYMHFAMHSLRSGEVTRGQIEKLQVGIKGLKF